MWEVSEDYLRQVIASPIPLNIMVLSTVVPWYLGAHKLTILLPTCIYGGIKLLIQKYTGMYIDHRVDMKEIQKSYKENFFVAEIEGKVVGTVGILPLPDEYHNVNFNGEKLLPTGKMVFSVSVDSSFRRRGIAKLLMEHVHKVADGTKIDLFLTTSMVQTRAAALYRRLGYVEDRWPGTQHPSAQFNDVEKYVYGNLFGFFKYGFFRKSKEKSP